MKRANIGKAIGAVVASISMGTSANAAEFYYGGYDVVNAVQGTPDAPVGGDFVVPGQITFYSDAAGTTPNAAGTGFVTATDTSAVLVLGGGTTAANYTANGGSGTGSIAIRGIALTSTNPGQNTLNFGFTSGGRYSIASGGSGAFGMGITLNGSSDWLLANGGAANSPLRMQNSSSISGSGTGTLSIPFNLANASGSPSLTVNLSNGGKVVFGASNDFGSANSTSPAQFTLTNGTVDFRSARPFGNARNQVRLNGGTLTSSNGTTMSTVYTGTAQAGPAGGIMLGGNLTFTGSTAWGLGTSSVTLTGTRTLTANTGGATGTTVGGVISDGGNAFGLTVGSASTGRLTLTGANTYTGPTTVQGGTLALGAAAQAAVLNAPGYADITGGKVLFDYTGGTSPVANLKTLIDTSAASGFTTGQFRSTGIAANRTLGYADNGADTVTVMFTVPGDADLDGKVDFNDFLVLQNNFNGTGTTFGQGNFDFNNVTDFNDFLVLQNNFGTNLSGAAANFTAVQVAAIQAFAAAVPEPTMLAWIGISAAATLRRRRAH